MSVLPIDENDDADASIPRQLTPQFSLAYLRDASDPSLLLTADGRISFLNPEACRLFDLADVESVRGRVLWELWPLDDAEPVLRHGIERAAAGEAVVFATLVDESDDDSRVRVTMTPVVNAEGHTESVFAIIQNA